MKTFEKQRAFHLPLVDLPYFVEFQGLIYLGWGHPERDVYLSAYYEPFVEVQDLNNWSEFYILESTPERLRFLRTQWEEDNYCGLVHAMRYCDTAEEMSAYCERINDENTL